MESAIVDAVKCMEIFIVCEMIAEGAGGEKSLEKNVTSGDSINTLCSPDSDILRQVGKKNGEADKATWD